MLGDGRGALDVLRRGSIDNEDPRTLRLVVEALAILRDERALRSAARRLDEHPGWRTVAAAGLERARVLKERRLLERIGLGLFALGLAVLGMGGARALLKPRWATVWMAGCTVAAMTVLGPSNPRAGPLVGLLGAGFAVLAHAASATVDRTRPDARGRLLAVALMGLAASGLVLSVAARLGLEGLRSLVQA